MSEESHGYPSSKMAQMPFLKGVSVQLKKEKGKYCASLKKLVFELHLTYGLLLIFIASKD